MIDQATLSSLAQLLFVQNPQIVSEALSIILQYSVQQDNLEQLSKLPLKKIISKLKSQQLKKLSTTIMINLSINSSACSQIMQSIEDICQQFLMLAKSIEENKLQFQLVSLLIVNLSRVQNFFKKIQQKQLLIFLQSIVQIYLNKGNLKQISHLGNVVNNLSSTQQGRLLLNNRKFCQRLYFSQLFSTVPALKTLKNCLFDYENQQFMLELFKSENKLADQLGSKMLRLEKERKQREKGVGEYQQQVSLIVDCILLMVDGNLGKHRQLYDKNIMNQVAQTLQGSSYSNKEQHQIISTFL